MSTSTITVRVEDSTKRRFEHICGEIGLTSSSAINAFIRAVLRENGIPFPLKADDSVLAEIAKESLAPKRRPNQNP